MEDELLTANDVAGLFKISPDTVYAWRYQGRIPYVKINGAVRFRRRDLIEMIETGMSTPMKPAQNDRD